MARAAGTVICLADDFEEIEQFPFVGQHRGNGLAGIQHAASSEADHQVTTVFLCERDSALHSP